MTVNNPQTREDVRDFDTWLKGYVGKQDASKMRFSLAELRIAYNDGCRHSALSTDREAVCANCKGAIGDLAPGRDPEEFCDTCYEHSQEARAIIAPAAPVNVDALREAGELFFQRVVASQTAGIPVRDDWTKEFRAALSTKAPLSMEGIEG